MDIVPLADEQLFSQRILQLAYTSADSRLRDAKITGSLPEMPGAAYLGECSEIVDVQSFNNLFFMLSTWFNQANYPSVFAILSIIIFNFTCGQIVAKKCSCVPGSVCSCSVQTDWRAFMKYMIAGVLAVSAALHTVNAVAQEADDSATDTSQDSEIYLEEIRIACEGEAVGLPDAQDYIEQCINNMKQSFTSAQE